MNDKLIFVREEEVKNHIAQQFFADYNCTKILGNVDFSVAVPDRGNSLFETQFLLWAEAKAGRKSERDFYAQFVQLILTIGRAKTFNKHYPPAFLGAFDAEKIGFIPYNKIQAVFYQNDFNWSVTSSDYSTKEFIQLYEQVKSILEQEALVFHYQSHEKELRHFIKENFVLGKAEATKLRIDKNNFKHIYDKWVKEVKPSIDVVWEDAKKVGIIDGDFYLADILSKDNATFKDKLFVLLQSDHYELDRRIIYGFTQSKTASFKDGGKAHQKFWNRYERPPKEEYWDYIIDRRDLLVPPDVRERKGSFFTPQKWVELSQEYIAKVLGEDWQDEYYVWDCAAGTGNLLEGLTNKSKLWASTLDKPDVDVMKERIINNSATLFENHVFQFDFLNDEFIPESKGGKIPDELYKIISDPEERKRLVVYINPPYAEAGDSKQRIGTGKNKEKVSITTKTYHKYKDKIGKASVELFAQFLIRIHQELAPCTLANFSKLKNLQASNFLKFRQVVNPKLEKLFVVPANTFDNVPGKFPIGFFMWNLGEAENFYKVSADVYDSEAFYDGKKTIYSYDDAVLIGKWLTQFKDTKNTSIGMMNSGRNDFQNQNLVYIRNKIADIAHSLTLTLTNIIPASIFFAVRHVIDADWLNDRDQFLYPNERWKEDLEFQNDCLAYTLFNNNISSSEGINHWIPYTEAQVGIHSGFESHFMSDFISGKLKPTRTNNLFEESESTSIKREFSDEAQAVMDAGLELWRYYFTQPNPNINASYYDIREHFQGRNKTGKMNLKSDDNHYMELIGLLRSNIKALAKKLEPKVYEYGFLRQ